MNYPELQGRRALVTGGSRGIGRCIVLRLAENGADVAFTYARKESAALAVADEVRALGRVAHVRQANLNDKAESKAVGKWAMDVFGGVDVFVSNAAQGVLGPATRMTPVGYLQAINVSCISMLEITRQIHKGMIERQYGRIVGISSLGSHRVLPSYAAIGASKAVLENLAMYLAMELGGQGINVNCVSGGPVDTDALTFFRDNERLKISWARSVPANRLGTAEEIADVALFLCSDGARWIQGHTIVADGGLSLTGAVAG